MKIDQLIETLQQIRDQCGNLDVEYAYNDCGCVLNGSADVDYVEVGTHQCYDRDTDQMHEYQYVVLW